MGYWDKLVDAKNAEVTRLNGIYSKLLSSAGVDFYEGYAKVIDPHTVEVNGKRFSAKHICVATGGQAVRLPIPGCDLPGTITSDEALTLTKRPEKLVVLWGGYMC